MSNLEYHALLRLPAAAARKALGEGAPPEMAARLEALGDAEVAALLADVGGHDLDAIVEAFEAADGVTDRPVAILAWTLKGWRLPFAGDPLNHGAQLTGDQLVALRRELGVAERDEWAPFPSDSAEGRFIQRVMAEGIGLPRRFRPPPVVPLPDRLDMPPRPTTSTQEAFGDVLAALGRQPGLESALITVSADVTTTTHLSGWVNRRGVYATGERDDAFERHGLRPLIRWKESPAGQHSSSGSERRRSSCSCRSWDWRRSSPVGGSARSARCTTASCRGAWTPCYTPPTRRRASSWSPAPPASASPPRAARTSRS
jgi:pyruvate dehydrogenase E1 component